MFKKIMWRLPLVVGLAWTIGLSMPMMSCIGGSSSDESENFFPETCAEIQENTLDETGSRPENGTYTLYIDGDELMPWDAYCYDMKRSEPKEFLAVEESDNYSQISDGVNIAQTNYRRLRIDPISLTIDPLDDTFADSNFDEFDPSLPDGLSSIPAGWAEVQPTLFNAENAEAAASLADTPFTFDESILENNLLDFFCSESSAESFDYETEGTGAEVSADLKSFVLTAVHINSMGNMSDVYAREIADCENLSDADNLTEGAWPLIYVGE